VQATIVLFGLVFALGFAAAADIRFAGVPIKPGTVVRAEVPLNATEKSYAADANNSVPSTAVAVVAVPRNFDPQRTWPVLVVFSTSNFNRLNRDDLIQFYRDIALTQGWIVLAGDGRGTPANDTHGWRAAMTLAAIDALHNSFAGSRDWPIALAGFSGGAKRASVLAPVMYLTGVRLCGLYLSGLNEDFLSASYRKSRIGPDFLKIPIFISSGINDGIAPVGRAREVAAAIRRTGFQSVRFETFAGGHAVKNEHTVEALRWFRKSL
jgi:pimeloyl-ACP methyl ester carboxylesterase